MDTKRAFVGCLLVSVLLLAGCAGQVPATSVPAPAPAATPVPVAEAPAVDVRVIIDADYIIDQLNSQLSAGLAGFLPEGQTLQILDPDLVLIPDDTLSLTATVAVQVLGINISLRPTVFVSLAVVDGDLQVDIAGISLGQFALPPALIEAQMAQYQSVIQQQIEQILLQLEEASGLRLQDLVVTADSLIIDLGR